MGRILFITGTDTGVGKTVLTGLLLAHLRSHGVRALAVKPFCTGGHEDVKFLAELQDGELAVHEINPYFFRQPLAPAVAARNLGKRIDLNKVVRSIRVIQSRCDVLLVEGAGGLLVPLTGRLTVADLIRRLDCEVILTAANRLGTINHTLLTAAYLRQVPQATAQASKNLHVVLMGQRNRDASSTSNLRVLKSLAAPARVDFVPYLGPQASDRKVIKKLIRKIEKTLASILRIHKVCVPVDSLTIRR